MYTLALVILVFLPNGEHTGTVQYFESKQECMRSGAMLVREYMREFEGGLILPACIPGQEV